MCYSEADEMFVQPKWENFAVAFCSCKKGIRPNLTSLKGTWNCQAVITAAVDDTAAAAGRGGGDNDDGNDVDEGVLMMLEILMICRRRSMFLFLFKGYKGIGSIVCYLRADTGQAWSSG